MYHAVKLTNENIPAITEWLPTIRGKDYFHASLPYLHPKNEYYVVMEIHADGQTLLPQIVNAELVEGHANVVMLTLS